MGFRETVSELFDWDRPGRDQYAGTKGSHRSLAREIFWEHHDRETYECPDCRRTEPECVNPFEVHHKSGVPVDNSPENLIALCRPCHNLREGKKPSIEEVANLRNKINDVDGAASPELLAQFQHHGGRPVDYDFEYIQHVEYPHVTTGVLRDGELRNRCDLCGGLFPKENISQLFSHVYAHNEESPTPIEPFHNPPDPDFWEHVRERPVDDSPEPVSGYARNGPPAGVVESGEGINVFTLGDDGVHYLVPEDSVEDIQEWHEDVELDNPRDWKEHESALLECCEELGIEVEGPYQPGSLKRVSSPRMGYSRDVDRDTDLEDMDSGELDLIDADECDGELPGEEGEELQ